MVALGSLEQFLVLKIQRQTLTSYNKKMSRKENIYFSLLVWRWPKSFENLACSDGIFKESLSGIFYAMDT